MLLVILPILGLSMGGGAFIFALIADVVLIALSIRIVSPNTVRTVEFLGKFNRILRPGFHFIIPFLEWTKNQVLFKRNFPVEVEGITGDNVTGYIGLNVIYYVEDENNDSKEGNIYKSVYSIDDPKNMMRATIDEQLRAMMVTFTHKDIFEKREEIGEVIEERLRTKLSSFGYKLDSIQVRDVKLETTVMRAMNKIVETQKLKEAALNEAEAQKIMQVKEAEAEKEAKILLGEGMAGQRMKIAEGFKESVDMIRKTDDSLNAEKVLQFLLDSSRIETLGSIGGNENSKLVYLNEDLEGRGGSKTDRLVA
jgi:regulator of protease activity HflC (stomatin/prohibitin superfamily)